jgi:hypothetical protein
VSATVDALPDDVHVRLRPPPGVREIAERLEAAGHETWCVGGAVRDAVLRHPSLDWDLATAATPDVVRRLFRRTVPKGIEFGTVGVFDRHGVMHEVTTFRRDVRTDGRHAEVEFGASLDDDLARRDFTINAIAFSPARGVLHDPFDGLGDLARRVVRAVGDPSTRLREDRLRALRAIRFAGRFGFAIEPATWAAIVESAPHLGRLSPERVREELEKTMRQVARPSAALEQWRASGALAALVPALAGQPREALAAADCLPMPRSPGARSGSGTAWPRRGSASTAWRWSAGCARCAARTRRCAGRRTSPSAGCASRPSCARRSPTARRRPRTCGCAAGPPPRPHAGRAGAPRGGGALRRRAGSGLAAPDAARLRAAYRRLVRAAYRDPIVLGDLAVSGADLQDEAGVPAGPRLGRFSPAARAGGRGPGRERTRAPARRGAPHGRRAVRRRRPDAGRAADLLRVVRR